VVRKFVKKFGRTRFTFVVIPDANRAVVRFRLSFFVLLAAGIIMLGITVSAVVLAVLNARNADAVSVLQRQLADAIDTYNQQLAEKNDQIASLESSLTDLAEFARVLEEDMQNIRILESEIRQITDAEGEGFLAVASLVEGGQGGEEIPYAETDLPVREVQSSSLGVESVSDIENAYQYLEAEIGKWMPRLEQLKEAVLERQAILRVTPTILPTSQLRVTSEFGMRRDPFTRRLTFHAGIDLGGKTGDPVYAAADGKVIESAKDRTHGNYIVIDHGRGIKTRYLHLSKRRVDAGEYVQKGQRIGDLGNTGRSTGPHLHYEVIVNGKNVDPWPYIKSARKDP